MGHAVVYCAACGQHIQERDIAMGRVLDEQGRLYCPACQASAPPTAVTYLPAPQETPTVLRDVHAVRSSTPPPPPPPPQGTSTALLGAVVAAVIIVAGGLAVILFMRPAPPAPPPAVVPAAKPADPVKVAQAEADRLDEFRRSTQDPESIATRARETLAKVEGTPYAERVRGILREAERSVELKKGEASIDKLITKAKSAADADPGFTKRGDVRAIYKEARGIADKLASTRLSLRVSDAEGAYDKSFDDAAKRAVSAIVDEVNGLLREERVSEALKAFDTLPAAFKDTPEGRQLESEKRRLVDAIARAQREQKMTIMRDFNRATRLMNEADKTDDVAKGYKESADLYAQVLKDVDDPAKVREQELTAQQVAQVKSIGWYNVACYYARFTDDVDQAVASLERSIKAGYNDWTHLEKDTDFERVRKNPKFEALLAKYRKQEE